MGKKEEFFKMIEESGDLPSSGMAGCRPVVMCGQCGGQGWITQRYLWWPRDGATFIPKECPSCGGTGKVEVRRG